MTLEDISNDAPKPLRNRLFYIKTTMELQAKEIKKYFEEKCGESAGFSWDGEKAILPKTAEFTKEQLLKLKIIEEYIYTDRNFTHEQILSIKAEIEQMDRFDGWLKFYDTWDILWVGLFVDISEKGLKKIIKNVYWKPGFHGPMRKLIFPLRIVSMNEKLGRMETTFEDTRDIIETPIPEHLKKEIQKHKHVEQIAVGQTMKGGDNFGKQSQNEKVAEMILKKQMLDREINNALLETDREEKEKKNKSTESI